MNEMKEILRAMWLPMLIMVIFLFAVFTIIGFELSIWGECLEKNSFLYCLRTLG